MRRRRAVVSIRSCECGREAIAVLRAQGIDPRPVCDHCIEAWCRERDRILLDSREAVH